MMMASELKGDNIGWTRETCEEYIRGKGWVQYSCTASRWKSITEQYDKLVGRMLRDVVKVLEKRGIVDV